MQERKQKKKVPSKCDTMGGTRFSEGVGASQRIPLSALAWNSYKGPEYEISHENGRGKEGPREDRES